MFTRKSNCSLGVKSFTAVAAIFSSPCFQAGDSKIGGRVDEYQNDPYIPKKCIIVHVDWQAG
jgi:hypothetical protein